MNDALVVITDDLLKSFLIAFRVADYPDHIGWIRGK